MPIYYTTYYLIQHIWSLTKNCKAHKRKKIQPEKTKQTSEQDTDMTNMLKIRERNFNNAFKIMKGRNYSIKNRHVKGNGYYNQREKC